ncbi:transposase and inactivated derivatives [Methylobacterium aquaticum]|uniref:Transposase and inactivated derivatives n=1 Tax=Methylobacterium aquaticum TaxID=270351 RepID=A0A1Y0ZC99_9HYPH|nr:transposase and inactivated derivatives [Methylobacterium aquaticum]
MEETQFLNPSKWNCKYNIIFTLKRRRKALYGELRQHLGATSRTLAQQKESRIEEGHIMRDHVHMMIAIPPRYAASRSSASPKARAPSMSPGCMGSASRISWISNSGPGAPTSPQLVETRRRSGPKSGSRSRSAWSSWTSGTERHRQVVQ